VVVKAFNTLFAQVIAAGADSATQKAARLSPATASAQANRDGAGGGAQSMGFDVVDAGALKNARYLEPPPLNIYLGYGAGLGNGHRARVDSQGLNINRTTKDHQDESITIATSCPLSVRFGRRQCPSLATNPTTPRRRPSSKRRWSEETEGLRHARLRRVQQPEVGPLHAKPRQATSWSPARRPRDQGHRQHIEDLKAMFVFAPTSDKDPPIRFGSGSWTSCRGHDRHLHETDAAADGKSIARPASALPSAWERSVME